MKKLLISSVLAGILGASMLNAEVYATVNGQKITDKDMEIFKQIVSPEFSFSKLSKQDKEMAIQQLIDRKLLLLAAQKDKIEKSKEFKEAATIIQTNLMIDLWLKQQQQKFASEVKVTAEDAKNFYNNNKNLFIDQQAQVRQIVVKSKEEADKIISDLKGKKGDALLKEFKNLANTKSIDQGTQKSQNGGDLGTVNRNQMLPQFVDAVFSLSAGSITTTPIQTDAGYHIIYLASKTEPKTLSFDEAKTGIENALKGEKINQMLKAEMEKMRKSAKIKVEPIK